MNTTNKELSIPNKNAQKIKLAVFDFDGVFTDNSVWISPEGIEFVRCSRSDGLGLKKLKEFGIPTFVLSTETNPIVTVRCQKMNISSKQGLENKLRELKKLAEDLHISLREVSYTGNDINDLECLNAVGIPIAVKDAYPEILKSAKYVTTKLGGFGAVREVCDWIVDCKNYGKI